MVVASDKRRPTVSEDKKDRSDDGLQHPLTHEGADPEPGYDSNERADDRVRIEQPSGEEAPRAE